MDEPEHNMHEELSGLIQDGLDRSDDCMISKLNGKDTECHTSAQAGVDRVRALEEREECLQDELASLRAELEEANREKIKAAEYGLLALEEKHQLEQQLDELDGAHQATRHELESTLQLLEELRSENSLRDRKEEALRLQLVQESEQREAQLVESAKEMEAEVKRLQQAVKNESERRQDLQEQVQEVHFAEFVLGQSVSPSRNQEDIKASHRELAEQNEELRQQLQTTRVLQDKLLTLQQANLKLQQEKEKMNEDMETLALGRQELEAEALQAADQLQRAHELRLELEGKLDELQLMSVSRITAQSPSLFDEIDGGHFPNTNNPDEEEVNQSFKSSLPHQESLLSELQMCADDDSQMRISELEEALAEGEKTVGKTKEELVNLLEKHAALTKLHEEKEEQHKVFSQEKEKELDHLKQQLNSRLDMEEKEHALQEQLEALKKENGMLKEKVAELEEAATKSVFNFARQEQLEKEMEELKERGKTDQHAQEELSKKLQELSSTSAKYEESMKGLVKELRSVSSEVEKIDRLASSLTRGKSSGTISQVAQTSNTNHMASLDNLVATLHDQVKSIKSAMELVLQRSLKQVVATTCLSEPAERNLSDESKKQYHVQIQRLRQQLSTKQQEVLTLRTVLQAQRSTSAAALERERTNSERKQRNTLQQMERQAMEVKRLEKEITETATFRSMFAGRCEEYIAKLAAQEKKNCSLAKENNVLEDLLRRAVQQKVMLTERLEELEIEREQSATILSLKPTKI